MGVQSAFRSEENGQSEQDSSSSKTVTKMKRGVDMHVDKIVISAVIMSVLQSQKVEKQ